MGNPLKRFLRACAVDGNTDAAQLQEHRIAGITVTLCHRCHQRLLERTSLPLRSVWRPPDSLEMIGRVLIEEAELFMAMAQSRWVLGHFLIDRVFRDSPDDDDDNDGDDE